MMDFAPFAWGSCTQLIHQHTSSSGMTATQTGAINLRCALSRSNTYLACCAGIASPLSEDACHLCRQDMEQGHQATAEQLEVPAPAMDGQAQQQLAQMRQPTQELSAFVFTCVHFNSGTTHSLRDARTPLPTCHLQGHRVWVSFARGAHSQGLGC